MRIPRSRVVHGSREVVQRSLLVIGTRTHFRGECLVRFPPPFTAKSTYIEFHYERKIEPQPTGILEHDAAGVRVNLTRHLPFAPTLVPSNTDTVTWLDHRKQLPVRNANFYP